MVPLTCVSLGERGAKSHTHIHFFFKVQILTDYSENYKKSKYISWERKEGWGGGASASYPFVSSSLNTGYVLFKKL